MKVHILSISFLILFSPSYIETKELPVGDKIIRVDFNNRTDALYHELHLSDFGLSQKAFEYAYRGYQYLSRKQKLSNPGILCICDLSQSSNKKRLYIIDLDSNKVLLTSYVAHGKGSGMEYATHFSNRARSHQSSLGFYVTGSTYFGEHGLSLRLQGLEVGFNDHAVKRNIVVHGASYIGNDYLQENRFMGRSYGCPAVPSDDASEIINLIKDGSCLFIYHPTKIYLQKSRILNG